MTKRSLLEIKNEFEKIEKEGMEYTSRNARYDELIKELEQYHGKLPFPITKAPDSYIEKDSVQLAHRINYAKFY